MSLKIEANKELYALGFHICFVGCVCWAVSIISASVQEWYSQGAVLIAFSLIENIILIGILRIGIISFESVFLLASYVFHLAQTVLLSMGFDFKNLQFSLVPLRLGDEALVVSSGYALISIQFLLIGVVLYRCWQQRRSGMRPKHKKEQLREIGLTPAVKKAGTVLAVITIPCSIYVNAVQLFLLFTAGYGAAHDASINPIVQFLAEMMPAALFLLMVMNSDKVAIARSLLIGFVVYEVVSMFGGERAYALIAIFIMVYCYHFSIEKINGVKLMTCAVVGALLVYIMVLIREGRIDGSYGGSVDSSNIVFTILGEFGTTINVLANSMHEGAGPAYGLSLLTGVLAVIPGWTYIFGTGLRDQYYTLYALGQQSWGSSYISDLYFDFGVIGGLLACLIFGFFLALFGNRIKSNFEYKRYFENAFWIPFSIFVLFSVRSYIFRLPRYFIWELVLFLIVYIVVKRMGEVKWIKGEDRLSQKHE